MNRQQRIKELNQLAAEEGIQLPWPAEAIARLEEQGKMVDLVTGLVSTDEQRVALTVIGEAVAIASAAWGKEG